MNKHLYRLIFSKSQQRVVVVSEMATREGKAKGEGGQMVAEEVGRFTFLTQGWRLSAVNLSLFTVLGFLLVSNVSANELQIRADQSAPKNQQAIILQTANGLPQVNIQTPNDKGLSHNKYQQFDVDTQGAILNNSRTEVQTEQGGWVQGNPYLARSEAKVILNEVNSNNPSQLKGYVEVAGKRAEVIIANPSGIHCEGCGTINAGRTALTTGKVELENGMVKGYQVEQGKVTVSGRGMDTSRSDYTDIIARETEINAGIWAKELKVTTGINKVSADNQSVQVIHKSKQNDTEQPAQTVRYAVDVSELGGMYAGKIHLVGTEEGLGVRNAGHIGATQGHVRIDSQGQIVNSGFVGAQQDVKLSAKHQIENRGTVYTQQGDVQLQSQTQGIDQRGSVIAKGDSQSKGKVRLQAKGKIAQQGETFAESDITYQANQIEAGKSAVLAAGVRFEQTENGERKTLNAASESGKNLTLTAEQRAVAQGQNLASGQISVQAEQIDLNNSQTSANRLQVEARSGAITADNSIIRSETSAEFRTPTALSTQGANLNAEQLHIQAYTVNNDGGSWQQRSTQAFNLDLQGGLSNWQGQISSAGDINLKTAWLNNQQGLLEANANLNLNTQQGGLNNRQGTLSSQQNLTLNSGVLNNQGGLVQSGGRMVMTTADFHNQQGIVSSLSDIQLDSQQYALNNKQGKLIADKTLQLFTGALDNQGGVIRSLQQLAIVATEVINNRKISDNGSLIQAGNQLKLTTKHLDNRDTKATTEKPKQGILAYDLDFFTETVNNKRGGIYSTASLEGNIRQTLDNRDGEIFSLDELALQGDLLALYNQQGQIESRGHLTLHLDRFINEGNIKTQADADIVHRQDLTLNQAFQVDGILNLSLDGNFNNRTKLITGRGLHIKAKQLDNPFGRELSAMNTYISAEHIINRGLIDGDVNVLKTTQLDNIGTGRIYGGHLSLQATTLRNDHETVNDETKSATIAAREQLDLAGDKIINKDGAIIFSLGHLYFGTRLNDRNNATGAGATITNANGVIEALGNIVFNHANVKNLHQYLETEIKEVSRTSIYEYSLDAASQRWRKGVDSVEVIRKDNQGGGGLFGNAKVRDLYALKTPDGGEHENWMEYDYTRVIERTQVLPPRYAEGRILSGGNIDFGAGNVTNQNSKIIAAGHFLSEAGKFIDNIETPGIERTTELGKVHHKTKGRKCVKNIPLVGCIDHADTTNTATRRYAPQIPDKSIKLGVFDYAQSAQEKWQTVSGQINKTIQTQTANQAATLTLNTKSLSEVTVQTVFDTFTIRTYSPILTLPQASLYKINPATNSHVLVETDPQFANRRQWLSSDYMFDALRSDHANMHKRLGDGFYEQRLINEQINQLTGRRFLGNYQSDYEQYKALMDSGIKYAEQFGLIPGIALSEAQMKELTTDMVWLVKREVRLADGSTSTVLVPQVYIVARDSDVTARGAVISANRIIANTTGDIENSGVIAGRQLTALSAENIRNLGGTLQGGQLLLEARQDLTNLGGSWLADKTLSAQAKNIQIESTLSETEDSGEFYKKGLNQLAKVRLNDHDGELIFRSQEDITIKGATFDIAGKTTINAGNQLNLGTLTTENKEHYNFNDDNYYRLHQTAEVGNQLNFNGDAILTGKNEVVIRGNQIHGDGKLLVASQGNIRIEEARQTEQLSSASKTSSKGLLSKTTEIRKHDHDYDLAVGSQIDAKKILIQSKQGDVKIIGSDVVAEDTMLIQGKNVSIVEAENRMREENFSQTTKKGVMSSGGFGFTIGSRQTTLETDNRKYYSRASQVGTLNGDMLVVAEKDYLQRGSAVTSVAGDTQVQAKRINITAADDRYETDQKYTFEQKGLTVAVNVPALQAVQSAVETVKNIGGSKNDRINAMGAANAAWDSYKAGKDLKALGEGLANGDMPAQNVSVSITYGEQKNINQTHTQGNTANSSKLHAGGKALLITTGEKDTSHIHIKGSDVAGLEGTVLQTAGKIDIAAAEQNHQERSKNSSQGWNAGVAVSYGSDGFAFGVTAGGNVGRGYGNGDERTWVNSHVGLQESNTTIISGGDTHIVGGVVRGKGVHTDIGGDLTIASLQDSLQYKGKQQNVSGQITVGYGVSGSASYNQSKINADYASVQEQSGIFAGDDGYQVAVKGHTELSGGLITSTAQAESEGKNRFRTGTIGSRDIENHANYKGSTLGVSGGFSVGGGESAKEVGGVKLAPQGQNYAQQEGDPNGGKGKTDVSMGIGFGSDSSSAGGVTRSGINTRNIEITDSVAQQTRTGKSAETALRALQTDITTESAVARSGRVSNQFDKDALQKELDIQRTTTESFGKTAAQGVAYTAEKLGDVKAYEVTEGIKAQAEQALKHETDPNKRAVLKNKIAQADAYLEQNQANYALWKEGGTGRTALHAIAGGVLTGNVSGAVASGTTSAAAPHLNVLGQELGDVGKAVLDIGAGMAIGAATGGGTAAVSAGGNTDWHNRQLHPREMDWIRDNAAAFAKEQGISVAEAEQRLVERAAQRVDYAWSKMIDSQDTAADSFLSSVSGIKGDVPSSSAVSFINSDGKQQNLFSASRDEYYSTGKYSDLAARYNRENNQLLTNTLVPKVKNNLVFEGVKDGGNALSEAARAALNSPTETLRGVTGNLAHSLSECLKHPTACATEKWATFDSASGDLLRTHYNQADVNALYGKEMTAETALVPLVRGGTVVAEVLPAAKAGAVAVKSIDNMLSPLAKGVSANDKLPVVGKTEGYENQTTTISIGAENNATAVPLKIQLSNESLKASGSNLDKAEVIARAELNGKIYIDTNQKARANNLADHKVPTLISDDIGNKPPQRDGTPYPNSNMAEAHAEIGTIQQAYNEGRTQGQNMTINVQGRDVCDFCKKDIALAAQKAGLKSVVVRAVDEKGIIRNYHWTQGQSSIKHIKGENNE
ncbi:two-partner secretion domain-containing protein [Testudinibacter sp. P80/BLE/0925]|uniref:two-partner secretion domain-containing protein n=1 Tax=Testudinibacter sp. TW-1 TaxID=3417757 RepID=UPI003D35A7FE